MQNQTLHNNIFSHTTGKFAIPDLTSPKFQNINSTEEKQLNNNVLTRLPTADLDRVT